MSHGKENVGLQLKKQRQSREKERKNEDYTGKPLPKWGFECFLRKYPHACRLVAGSFMHTLDENVWYRRLAGNRNGWETFKVWVKCASWWYKDKLLEVAWIDMAVRNLKPSVLTVIKYIGNFVYDRFPRATMEQIECLSRQRVEALIADILASPPNDTHRDAFIYKNPWDHPGNPTSIPKYE
jgi:hypothetical protein